jgi:hypothetical protein
MEPDLGSSCNLKFSLHGVVRETVVRQAAMQEAKETKREEASRERC